MVRYSGIRYLDDRYSDSYCTLSSGYLQAKIVFCLTLVFSLKWNLDHPLWRCRHRTRSRSRALRRTCCSHPGPAARIGASTPVIKCAITLFSYGTFIKDVTQRRRGLWASYNSWHNLPNLWASVSTRVHICATEYVLTFPNKCSSQSCVLFDLQQHTTNGDSSWIWSPA